METEEQSLFNEMESLFDDDESYESDSVSTMKVAREDIKLMNVVRAMAVLTLLTIAFIAGEVVFVVATIAEQNNFKQSYEEVCTKITNAFFLQLDNSLVVASTISSQLSSLAADMDWPFVSYYDFEAFCAVPRRVAQSAGMHFGPILDQSNRMQWETYAAKTYLSLSNNHTASANNPYLRFTNVEAEKSASYIATHRTVEDGLYWFQEGKAVSVSNLEEAGSEQRLMIPIWQQSPQHGNFTTGLIGTMFDEASNPKRLQAIAQMYQTSSGALTGFLFGDSKGTDYVVYHSPRVILYYPIFSQTAFNGNVTASLGTEIQWETFLEGSLDSDGTEAITVVAESSCSNDTYSYEVHGQNAFFVAPRAIYDTKIDGYEAVTTSYDKFDEVFFSHVTTNKTARSQTDAFCRYKLTFYPTQQFKDVYISQKPMLYKGIVLIVFLVIVVLFILYDRLIERQQNRVVVEATRSDAIVRSLFPDAVRQRLYDNAKKKEKQRQGRAVDESGIEAEAGKGAFIETPKDRLKKLLKHQAGDEFQPQTSNAARGQKQKLGDPIADLFPNTTILFADISGFTAWSSEREPSQVFTLLESIYKCMDVAAKKLGVFKVETVGDCYVAATGIPDPQDDHVEVMVRFARTTLVRIDRLTRTLESQLGPGTGELSMRFGIHSGPVTAGVLRGQKARFQLFGDTMNVASRMESTGLRNKIQISAETARILKERGHEHWVSPREDLVEVKGKGSMQTYWLLLGSSSSGYSSTVVSELSNETDEIATQSTQHSTCAIADRNGWAGTSLEGVLGLEASDDAQRRLIDWNTDVLLGILKNIISCRQYDQQCSLPEDFESQIATGGRGIRDQIQNSIRLPEYDVGLSESARERSVEVPRAVKHELRAYVSAIASGYRRNAFHNFEHASHVILSSNKLLKRIMNPDDVKSKTIGQVSSEELHKHTYGIGCDPLTHFAVVFSALIHDVGHVGVSNLQLAEEEPKLAEKYGNVSIAEQRSIEIAWDLLMLPRFKNLRACIYQTREECERFRHLVVNSVIATDIFDPNLKAQRNARWNLAFFDSTCMDDAAHRRATIVIDHIIQASDVSHTMQHWHVYLKWNERLYNEMHHAFVTGRSAKDPTESWYEGELRFFDNYVIPLARKLRECGVFGVSSDEYLSYALENRVEWERKGETIVQEMKKRVTSHVGMGDGGRDAKYEALLSATDLTESSETDNVIENIMKKVRQERKEGGKRNILAPPGKLGIAIDDSGGGPIITFIEEESPMRNKVYPGELIVAIDGVDISSMSVATVYSLMSAKSDHSRTITVKAPKDTKDLHRSFGSLRDVLG